MMKHVYFVLAFFASTCAFAHYPTGGYYHLSNVGRGRFRGLQALEKFYRAYNSYLTDRIGLNGEDFADITEAILDRSVCKNNAYPSRVAISDGVSASEFNRLVNGIDNVLPNSTGAFVFLNGVSSMTAIQISGYSPTVEDEAYNKTTRQWIDLTGYNYFTTFQQICGLTKEQMTVSSVSGITKDRFRRIFKAAYNLKYCVRDAFFPSLSQGDFTTSWIVEEKDKPTLVYNNKMLYEKKAVVTCGFYYDYQRVRLAKRYEYEVSRKEGYGIEYPIPPQGANNADYAVVMLVRIKPNWTTLSMQKRIMFFLIPNLNQAATSIKNIVSSLSGVSDDVQCPEFDDTLKGSFLQYSIDNPLSVGLEVEDTFRIRLVKPIAVQSYDSKNITPYWNSGYNLN